VCLLAVSQSAIVAAAFFYTLHPTPPTTHSCPHFPTTPHPISLASCHRLGLTGKRKHNQKDNVIMPQCGTIYTKLNTATKKNQHFLPQFLPPIFTPAHSPPRFPPIFLRFSLLYSLVFFSTCAVASLFFLFLASKRDPLFLQVLLPSFLKGCKWLGEWWGGGDS